MNVLSPQDDGSPIGFSFVLYSGDRGWRGWGIRGQRRAGEDLCEFKARTIWSVKMSSRKGKVVTRRNPVLKKKNQPKKRAFL